MSFMPSDDAIQFGQYLREFLAKNSSGGQPHGLPDSGDEYDAALWALSARQLGVQGLWIPEELGGSGGDLAALGVCFEELGRALVCAPFFSTVAIAAPMLGQLSHVSEDSARLLRRIADGSVIVAVAGLSAASGPVLVASGSGIDGVASIVVDGCAADCLLVAARGSHGEIGLYLVGAPLVGVKREQLTALDSTRPLARVTFSSAPAQLLTADARSVMESALDIAWLLLAAEQLGGAQATFDMALGYAKTRYQFGRPIGSFQAIKHRLAEMLVRVESARSVVYHALHESQANPAARPVEAALARAAASEAFLACASDNIQIHGGIGFTWEHTAHLYLKRAKSSALLFGDAVLARRRLAERLRITEAAP